MIENGIHCQILIEDCTIPMPYMNTHSAEIITIMNLLYLTTTRQPQRAKRNDTYTILTIPSTHILSC